MAKFTDKISNLLNSQAPEFVVSDHPKFLEFLKAYYTFMESAELAVTSVEQTDGIRLETEIEASQSSLLIDASRIDTDRTQLDSGDKILLENTTYGKFTRGETITGQSSGATSTILTEDIDNGKLYIAAQDKFIIGEAVIGASSNAHAIVDGYRPNPVNNIQDLLNFRDPDKVISNFLTKFRNEFLNTLPETLGDNVDKRKLIKNIKSVYRAKGTARGHQMFFRLLFGLTSETVYPRENMLRVSDGKWTTNKVLRAIQSSNQSGDPTELVGRTITGETSSATAIVESVQQFQIGENLVTEFILNDDSINGTFQTSEVVRGTALGIDDTFIKLTTTGIPGTITISNDGSLYNVNDSVTITGGGTGSIIQVDAIGNGGITDFIIDNAGTGYEIGDSLVFNNANTNGGAASAEVAVVNGGFTQEESTSTEDDHIVLEDETVRGDNYTGNKLVQESGTGVGDITDIRIINAGSNYTTLPTITITSTSGADASVIAYGDEIGKVQGIKIVESGAEYQQSPTPPTLTLPTYILVKDVSGSIVADTTATSLDSSSSSITATVSSFNSDLKIVKVISASGTFEVDREITFSNGASATIAKVDGATSTVTVTAVADTAGTFVNQDGWISEDAMRIQDSLYYQDFSYVIKVGRTINDWRDSFKKTMHTAGFYFTGQVNIENQISAQISSPVEGIISGIEESPIFGVIATLFSTIFGRRLGTVDDGTSLRANPELGVDPDFDDSTSEHFTPNTRDVTLLRDYTLIINSGRNLYNITARDNDYIRGYAYGGPKMGSLDIYNNPFASNNRFGGNHTHNRQTAYTRTKGTTVMVTPMTMAAWAQHTIQGFNDTSIDGTGVQIRDYAIDHMKTYIAYPSYVTATVPNLGFDQTDITFDETSLTFDNT